MDFLEGQIPPVFQSSAYCTNKKKCSRPHRINARRNERTGAERGASRRDHHPILTGSGSICRRHDARRSFASPYATRLPRHEELCRSGSDYTPERKEKDRADAQELQSANEERSISLVPGERAMRRAEQGALGAVARKRALAWACFARCRRPASGGADLDAEIQHVVRSGQAQYR